MGDAEMKPASDQSLRAKKPYGIQKQPNRFRNAKVRYYYYYYYYSKYNILFTKGAVIKTLPSLTMQLTGVTEPIIGLQYVWEYRSPSKSVPPHYQCKICNVTRLQHDMLAHVKGWKHSLRYMKRAHATKVTEEEEEATKDPLIRKKVKEASAEVESAEGRGKLKVILKEPRDVPAFQGLRTAIPKALPPPPLPSMAPTGPYSGGRFSDSGFQGEYPSHGGPFHNSSMGDYGEMDMGGFPNRLDYPGSNMNPRRFPDEMGPSQGGDDFRGNSMGSGLMDRPADRPDERPGLMGAHPESGSLPSTLLRYLDTFRIENEDDAQIVLKVTQKLTDVLMEYRLRSVSGGSSIHGNTSSSQRDSNAGDRYSGNYSGMNTVIISCSAGIQQQ
ncbi:hypothetical protein NHX12_001348 [Muraenolepis orangiensis]|uniref:Uncharacterized protein n=1 Tax=Muraenolepis orangiensis TaxID=630683 RepID=A0A9Q0E0A2_9TELE|nr:hypothetical protein NHX12_001348 [Muraenolepis orangiensis]